MCPAPIKTFGKASSRQRKIIHCKASPPGLCPGPVSRSRQRRFATARRHRKQHLHHRPELPAGHAPADKPPLASAAPLPHHQAPSPGTCLPSSRPPIPHPCSSTSTKPDKCTFDTHRPEICFNILLTLFRPSCVKKPHFADIYSSKSFVLRKKRLNLLSQYMKNIIKRGGMRPDSTDTNSKQPYKHEPETDHPESHHTPRQQPSGASLHRQGTTTEQTRNNQNLNKQFIKPKLCV